MATRRTSNVDSRTKTNTSKASQRKAEPLKQATRKATPLKQSTRDSATKYASQKMHSMRKQDAFGRQITTRKK